VEQVGGRLRRRRFTRFDQTQLAAVLVVELLFVVSVFVELGLRGKRVDGSGSDVIAPGTSDAC
jgi:hypothetical protein